MKNIERPVQQNNIYPEIPSKYSKKCRFCKQLIDKKAKICPYCRKRQGESCLSALVFVILVIGFWVVFYKLVIDKDYDADTAKPDTQTKSVETVDESRYMTESEYKPLCQAVTYEDLARDKNALKGQKLTFTGRIVQVKDDFYRIDITKTSWGYDDTIMFTYDSDKLDKNILEKDIVTIWGESEGMYTYKAVLGQEVTVPRIKALYIENNGQEVK